MLWKQANGISIYEMGQNRFLFEFPSMVTAYNVLNQDWYRKKDKVQLQWWNPMVGTVPRDKKITQMWIRIVGLPLHLWSHRVFKEVGGACGGWVETEEATELKNHLKWARIKVRGDGTLIPNTLKIEAEGILFEIQIWVEAPVRTKAERREEDGNNRWVKERDFNQRVKSDNLIKVGGARDYKILKGHVGCSDLAQDRSCESFKKSVQNSTLGPDFMAQTIIEEKKLSKPNPVHRSNPIRDEITALHSGYLNKKIEHFSGEGNPETKYQPR